MLERVYFWTMARASLAIFDTSLGGLGDFLVVAGLGGEDFLGSWGEEVFFLGGRGGGSSSEEDAVSQVHSLSSPESACYSHHQYATLSNAPTKTI